MENRCCAKGGKGGRGGMGTKQREDTRQVVGPEDLSTLPFRLFLGELSRAPPIVGLFSSRLPYVVAAKPSGYKPRITGRFFLYYLDSLHFAVFFFQIIFRVAYQILS